MLNCMPVCYIVLNLVISGIPSILLQFKIEAMSWIDEVLNLIINGIPSILHLGVLIVS